MSIHKILLPIVTGEYSNNVIVKFQRICGVTKDGLISNKFIYTYFRVASSCGEEIFSLMPLLFWMYYPVAISFTTNFGFLLMTGQILKDILKLPRPSAEGTGIHKLSDSHFETEYGMPSTHTISGFLPLSVVFFLQKNGVYISQTVWLYTMFYILSIGLSRLYLGVHSPLDIISGGVLGVIVTSFLYYYEASFVNLMLDRSNGIICMVVVLIFFLLFYPRPKPWRAGYGTAAQIVGTWLGTSSSIFYIHHMDNSLLQIFKNVSVVSVNNGLLEYNNNSLDIIKWDKIILRIIISVIICIPTKFVSKYISSVLLEFIYKMKIIIPNESEKIDSLNNNVPIHKSYYFEVPVRLFSYISLAWAVIVWSPYAWRYCNLHE